MYLLVPSGFSFRINMIEFPAIKRRALALKSLPGLGMSLFSAELTGIEYGH